MSQSKAGGAGHSGRRQQLQWTAPPTRLVLVFSCLKPLQRELGNNHEKLFGGIKFSKLRRKREQVSNLPLTWAIIPESASPCEKISRSEPSKIKIIEKCSNYPHRMITNKHQTDSFLLTASTLFQNEILSSPSSAKQRVISQF
jgi:hypothetical protein